MTAGNRRDILELLEDRYGLWSTIVTSQLPVSKWHDAIGDPTLADAILDRVVHNAHKITMKGDSLRKTKRNETLQNSGIREQRQERLAKNVGSKDFNGTCAFGIPAAGSIIIMD